jgi:hypothetical protein
MMEEASMTRLGPPEMLQGENVECVFDLEAVAVAARSVFILHCNIRRQREFA